MDPSKSLPAGDNRAKPRMRWFRLMLNLMVLTVVLAAVGVAASLHNQKKLRLVIENNQLIVEQGRLFPIGYEQIKPDTESKEKAYAPISLRDTMKVDVPI